MAAPELRAAAASAKHACVEIRHIAQQVSREYLSPAALRVLQSITEIVEIKIKCFLESTVSSITNWDNLPGEVKNEIYRYLLLSDGLIKPHVSNAGRTRKVAKHDLGGQLLCVSPTVYQEALIILLSENIFELSPSLEKYLGFDLNNVHISDRISTPSLRAALVKRVAVKASELDSSRFRILSKLRGAQKVIIWSDKPSARLNPHDFDWEQHVKDRYVQEYSGGWRVGQVFRRPRDLNSPKFYYVEKLEFTGKRGAGLSLAPYGLISKWRFDLGGGERYSSVPPSLVLLSSKRVPSVESIPTNNELAMVSYGAED